MSSSESELSDCLLAALPLRSLPEVVLPTRVAAVAPWPPTQGGYQALGIVAYEHRTSELCVTCWRVFRSSRNQVLSHPGSVAAALLRFLYQWQQVAFRHLEQVALVDREQ